MNQSNAFENTHWPNFLIIGAAKAGTTALHSFLVQHPDILMSKPKEPNFFLFSAGEPDFSNIADNPQLYQASVRLYERIKKISVVDIEKYQQLFAKGEDKIARGDASPLYLSHPDCPAEIKKYLPDAKLVVILRNPVDRAYSSYLHMMRVGHETRNFRDALEQEPVDSDNFWCGYGDYYIRPGFYAKQLKSYFALFDREKIKIYLYDDFVRDPQALIRDLYRFLGVNEEHEQDLSKRRNVSGVPKNRLMYNLSTGVFRKLTSSKRVNDLLRTLFPMAILKKIKASIFEGGLQKTKIKPEDREYLMAIFREDILELQDLIQRDLSAWLTGAKDK